MNKPKHLAREKRGTGSLERFVGPDWRKVAKERLDKLNTLEQQCGRLKNSLAEELERELSIQLHAHCLPRNIYESKLRGIAEFVAERVRPKLYGR